jgi:hypothetical protein
MRNARKTLAPTLLITAALLGGCAAPTVDFTTVEQPARAEELAAYDVFVGRWTWHAEVLNAEGEDKNWTGTAEWKWTLDDRTLHGLISARSTNASFDAAGVWSWHPKAKKYIWWMFNNWGYPQEGTATYDKESRTWIMKYTSVGLDGTASHGYYKMTVADSDTLEWSVVEWADPLHMFKKLEMKGTYTRES